MQYAPIALFTYNRADHTRQAVESLLQNTEAKYSDLFFFSDGAKTPEKQAGVDENRAYLKEVKEKYDLSRKSSLSMQGDLEDSGFKSITIIEREKNWGLANSLIAGITEVINQYGRIIVVEDDLILSPYFLKFMNDGLEKYKDADKVGTISAYVPPIKGHLPDTFFLMYFQCWGWATWKRAWILLEKDPRPLLKGLRFKKTKFDVGGGCGNYGNLYCQKVGLVDSWYLRYYASLFLKGKLSLYPGQSLADNNGMDGTGIHCKVGEHPREQLLLASAPIVLNDIEVVENQEAYAIFRSFFDGRKSYESLYTTFKSFVRRVLFIDCW